MAMNANGSPLGSIGNLKEVFAAKRKPPEPEVRRSATPRDFHWREKNIPCQKACPAETDIPAYLTAIADGDPDEAYRINLRDNIFPAVLGRVCSRPCEAACRHGWEGLGDSVAICFSKRSAADFAQQHEPVLLDPLFPPSGKRIAVVGGGVAGLAAGIAQIHGIGKDRDVDRDGVFQMPLALHYP